MSHRSVFAHSDTADDIDPLVFVEQASAPELRETSSQPPPTRTQKSWPDMRPHTISYIPAAGFTTQAAPIPARHAPVAHASMWENISLVASFAPIAALAASVWLVIQHIHT